MWAPNGSHKETQIHFLSHQPQGKQASNAPKPSWAVAAGWRARFQPLGTSSELLLPWAAPNNLAALQRICWRQSLALTKKPRQLETGELIASVLPLASLPLMVLWPL